MSCGNLPVLASPTRYTPVYFGGCPRGQGASPRCFIQPPILGERNSLQLAQNDWLMQTRNGAIPGSTTMTDG